MVNKMVGGIIMSRRGDNIRKRKDGRWEGRYVFTRDMNGKAIYRSVYGRTYAEVREKLSNILVAVSNAYVYQVETVNEVASRWLEEVKLYKKYSTYVKYEYIYINHIKQQIGNKKMVDVNEELCTALIDSEYYNTTDNSIKLSNSTINSIKNVLTQIVKYGTKNVSFKINNNRKASCNTKSLESIQIFTKCEQQRIIEYLLEDIDSYKLGILVCMFTGLRLGEICALRRDSIDLSNRTIKITQTVQRIKSTRPDTKTELVVSSPKTANSYRIVPICDMLHSILSENMVETYYVVNGSNVMEPRTYQYFFKKLLNSLSIEVKNFHCIRHTFATNCIDSGMEVKCLSEILGHSDVKTTLNKYVHPTLEQKINQINSFSYDYGQINGQVN